MKWRAGAASAVVALLVALPLAGWHARVATEARVDDVALAYASGIKAAVLDGLDLQTLELRSPAEPDRRVREVSVDSDGQAVMNYSPPPGSEVLVTDFFGLPAFELDADGQSLLSSPNLQSALGRTPLAPAPTTWAGPTVFGVRPTPDMIKAGLVWTEVDLACSETFATDEFDQADSPTPAIQQLGAHTRLRLCVLIDPAARSEVSREATTRDALVALVAALLVGAAISLLPIPALRPRLLLSRRWWARFGLRPRLCAAALLITMLVSIPLGAWLLAARPYRGIYNAPTGLVMTYVPGLVGAGFPWADGWLSQVPAETLLTDSQDHPLVTMISSDGQVLYSTAGASVARQLVPPPGWATTDQSLIPVTWPDDGAAADLSGQEITAVCGFARPLADVSLAMLFPGAQPVPSDATARSCVFMDPQAKRIDDVKIAAEILGWAALAGFGVAGFTWLIATLALAPLDRLRRQAAIGAGRRPTELVPVTGAGDAIDALADTFNESVVQLRQALESQRQFVADAAHELRSPITSLINALEVAERYPHLIDPRAVIDSSLTQSRRLAGLTQDLLLLARLDASAPHDLDRVELGPLATTVVAAHVGARVPVRRTGGEVATVGDRLQLERVLVNLVDNAVRHADTAVEVRVHLADESGQVAISVTNDGSPIAAADRERIFDRFARLDEARTRDGGGSGLGLAICREVARRHGGDVAVQAAERGTTFCLTLPEVR